MNKLIAFIFSARWNAIINIALATVLGHSTVQFILLVSTVPSTISLYQHNSTHSTIDQTQLPTLTRLNISTLLEAHLFGHSQAFASQTASQVANTLPETKLNLKLHGIYHSPNTSFAMIATQNGKSKLYRVGESLPSGAKLQKIEPKKVILLRNGQYETLRLIGSQATVANQLQDKYAKTVQGSDDNAKPEKLLGHYQRQLQTNPSSLMKLVRISPTKRNGRLIGYRIRPRKDATLLSQFNLQSGDILTTINGVKLDSPLKSLGIVQQLATANQVDLQVLRNGQVMSFSFTVEK